MAFYATPTSLKINRTYPGKERDGEMLGETPTAQNKEQQNYCFNTLNYLLELQGVLIFSSFLLRNIEKIAIASFILVSVCVILSLGCLIVTIVIPSGINIKAFGILRLCISLLSMISVILNIYILALLVINKTF
jgi:hypothetical protein